VSIDRPPGGVGWPCSARNSSRKSGVATRASRTSSASGRLISSPRRPRDTDGADPSSDLALHYAEETAGHSPNPGLEPHRAEGINGQGTAMSRQRRTREPRWDVG
jgi:hypothetical protein